MKAGTVSAHLDGDLLERLKALGVQQDRSVSWLINESVKRFLGDHLPGAAGGRQVDLEEAIAAAPPRAKRSTAAKHK